MYRVENIYYIAITLWGCDLLTNKCFQLRKNKQILSNRNAQFWIQWFHEFSNFQHIQNKFIPDIIMVPEASLVIVAGNSNVLGLWVVMPTSIDPDHLSTNLENNFTWSDFTIFSKSDSSDSHNFRFRSLHALYIYSNRCRHKMNPSISRILLESFC